MKDSASESKVPYEILSDNPKASKMFENDSRSLELKYVL
jgi:hypothetical protein